MVTGAPGGVAGLRVEAYFMGAVAALDVAVPALLVDQGRSPTSAGYLLGAFAASGIVGGAVYGARSVATQSRSDLTGSGG